MLKKEKAPEKSEKKNYYQMTRNEVLEFFDSRPGGLTSEEVKVRFAECGPNELPQEKKLSALKILLTQFKSPLVYVLLVAALISFIVGEFFDLTVILMAVMINTVVGFWQEYKADKTISRLKKLVEYFVTVERDGKRQQIPARDVVTGDILLLEAGDKISADGRLLQANNLQVDESSLTGESFPVDKHIELIEGELAVGDRLNMVYLGTAISRGRGKMVVVATGQNTEIGQIAVLVKETEEEPTPLQRQLARISKFLAILVGGSVLLVFAVGLLRGMAIEELFITAAALAVAAIPEGLLVAVTLVLVFGMQRILKKKALVRKLLAAETLGSVSVICSDKTGTITLGKMVVDRLLVGGETHGMNIHEDGHFEEYHMLALRAVALCNNAYIKNPQDKLEEWQIVGDSTETALLSAAVQAGFDKEQLNREYGRLDEIPFNETYKYMATLNLSSKGGVEAYIKGAPESVLSMCSHFLREGRQHKLDKAALKTVESEYEELTKQGLRVLAIAIKKLPKAIQSFDDIVKDKDNPKLKDLVFVGWVGLKDPVRPDVPAAFATIRSAGIRIVIITGDHKYTVKAIVEKLGMMVSEERIMEGVQLDKMDDGQLYKVIEDIDIFARVEPKHKLRIIQAWKKREKVVAMLGDGVNDAPALKAADIGVAVGNATDVAKETSDLIMIDGNFSVIEAAIREGRVIFDNIRKIFLYLVADSFTEIILIVLALLTGYPLPLAAVHILWINIVSDGLPDLALTMEPPEKDVMQFPPRDKNESIINKEVKLLIATITSLAVIMMFGLYVYFINTTGDIVYTRTLIFSAFAIDSIIYIFSVKSLRQPLWKINVLSNKWLVGAVIIGIAAQFIVVYTPALQELFRTVPLHASHWIIIFGLGFLEISAIEIIKWAYWRNKHVEVQI